MASSAANVQMAADPDRVWYFMDAERQQRGPVTPFDLADLLADRDINSSTYGWRAGLPEWVPLSSMAELKGIFATAFDAPDEVTGKTSHGPKHALGSKNTAASNGVASTAAASSTGANVTAAGQPSSSPAVVDPTAIWYYTDKYRAQHGPVPPATILHLYSLLQLHDASLVYNVTQPASGWTRLGETKEFEGQLGPELIAKAEEERKKLQEAEQKKQADKKRKREKKATAGGGNSDKWKQAQNNTSVYFNGLPPDVTVDELFLIAKKAGIILEDDTGAKRIKIYTDPVTGQPKGDAVVKYAMPESVALAITLLDQSLFRAPKPKVPGSTTSSPPEKLYTITVQKAEFTQKDKSDEQKSASTAASANKQPPAKRPKAQAGALTANEIAKQRLKESLSWDDEPQHSSKLKIVILKPIFTLDQVKAYPEGEKAFYANLKEEISTEIESKLGEGEAGLIQRGGRGVIEKLTIFESNPEGPCAIKFRQSQHASACLQLLNGRWFGGAKLTAFYFDGKTNYVVKRSETESAEEEARRLKEFGDWIEGNGGDKNQMDEGEDEDGEKRQKLSSSSSIGVSIEDDDEEEDE